MYRLNKKKEAGTDLNYIGLPHMKLSWDVYLEEAKKTAHKYMKIVTLAQFWITDYFQTEQK